MAILKKGPEQWTVQTAKGPVKLPCLSPKAEAKHLGSVGLGNAEQRAHFIAWATSVPHEVGNDTKTSGMEEIASIRLGQDGITDQDRGFYNGVLAHCRELRSTDWGEEQVTGFKAGLGIRGGNTALFKDE